MTEMTFIDDIPIRCEVINKMRYVLVALLLCVACVQAQPTGNVLSRVYEIRFNGELGTAFVMDYGDRQYFVTARHIMETSPERATVELKGPGTTDWKSYTVTVLLGKNKCVDVAVLIPSDKKLTNAEAIPYPYNFAFGQEVYFLGFPYGLYTSFGQNEGLGVALIKHGYVSARVSCAAVHPGGDRDESLILLDGINNPGFSGGPVVAPDMFSPLINIRAQKLIGVISGFQSEGIPVTVNGQNVPNSSVATNTGIIIVTDIQKAVDLIEAYVARLSTH